MSASKQSAKDLFAKTLLKAKAVVLNLSEVAVKAQTATNNEPWGPHGQLMTDIAEGCFDAEKFKEVWDVLKKRMTEGMGEKWRNTYKALLVIEFLVKQSSQHVVQVVLENVGIIQDLQKFQYKDGAGKDWGLNVRNRAKELCALLGSPERIREERAKARANREKYKGLSKAAAAAAGSAGSSDGARSGARSGGGTHTADEGEGAFVERGGYDDARQRERLASQLQSGVARQQQREEEEPEEDPVAATTRRIDSLRQSGLIGREVAPAAAAPAPVLAPVATHSRAPAPAPAPVESVDDSFEAAFPAAQAASPAAAAKPSLRALSEAKKSAPKKLGDVRVNKDIAAAFGGMKLPAPASPKPAAGPASPAPASVTSDMLAAPAPVAKSTAAAAPAPTAAAFDAFDAFTSLGEAPSPASAVPTAFEDPFAVLSGDRKPTPASLGSPAAAGKPGPLGGNPFAAPAISITATTAAAPLPEHMFTPAAFLPTSSGTPTKQAPSGSPLASPVRVGMASPAMKTSPLGLGASSPQVAAQARVQDDPFSAFNPFK